MAKKVDTKLKAKKVKVKEKDETGIEALTSYKFKVRVGEEKNYAKIGELKKEVARFLTKQNSALKKNESKIKSEGSK